MILQDIVIKIKLLTNMIDEFRVKHELNIANLQDMSEWMFPFEKCIDRIELNINSSSILVSDVNETLSLLIILSNKFFFRS